MNYLIRPYVDSDLDAIVELSLLAWEPVFCSFQQTFGPEIYSILYPDWRTSQSAGVAAVCQDTVKYHTLVAQYGEKVVGFLAYELKSEEARGEVLLLAVHPEYQNAGIGAALNLRALELLRTAGVKIAVVETGGDDAHAPARRAYEKAGYTPFPIVRYFKAL